MRWLKVTPIHVEAIRDYYARLAPGGYLALTRLEKQPPREGLKLFATAVEMLRSLGLDPRSRLALIRGWQTSTLLIKSGALTGDDVARLRAFCDERGFDPAWFAGIEPGEVNRRHRVPRPWLHEGAVALLGDDADRISRATTSSTIAPATDERPLLLSFLPLVAAAGAGRAARPGWAHAARHRLPGAGRHALRSPCRCRCC